MFFINREECEEAMGYLIAAGVKCDLVTGDTDREEQLDRFENGDTEVLVNMFVLTEGFDFPALQTVWVRDSGELPTIQMAGRVLRPHEDIPVANIVQSVKTRWPFTRTANIAKSQNLWHNESWRYVGRSKIVDEVACQTIKKLAQTEVDEDMLKKLRAMQRKGRRRRRQRG
jgi:superfamily II DNA or RNA helicase